MKFIASYSSYLKMELNYFLPLLGGAQISLPLLGGAQKFLPLSRGRKNIPPHKRESTKIPPPLRGRREGVLVARSATGPY